MDLDDVYVGDKSWSDLREEAGLAAAAHGPNEEVLRRACGRLQHVDDLKRLESWRRWLREANLGALSEEDQALVRMLLAQLLDQVLKGKENISLEAGASLLWKHPQVCAELLEVFDVLAEQISHLALPLTTLPNVPLSVHARYTRQEILGACGVGDGVKTPTWREGVYHAKDLPADLLAFTLDKTRGQFSPTTRYRDYAISGELIHWESQSTVRPSSPTGRRYQEHVQRNNHILLFARVTTDDAFYFLGPATYVSHQGELPMAITWRLGYALPGDLFAAFAAAVA